MIRLNQTQKDLVRVAASLTAYAVIAVAIVAVGWLSITVTIGVARMVGG